MEQIKPKVGSVPINNQKDFYPPQTFINSPKKNQNEKSIYRINLSNFVLPRSKTDQTNSSLKMHIQNLKIDTDQLENDQKQLDTPHFCNLQESINPFDRKRENLLNDEQDPLKKLKERLKISNQVKSLSKSKKELNKNEGKYQENYDTVLRMFTNRKKLIEENEQKRQIQKKFSNLQTKQKIKQDGEILLIDDKNYSNATLSSLEQQSKLLKYNTLNSFKYSKLQLQNKSLFRAKNLFNEPSSPSSPSIQNSVKSHIMVEKRQQNSEPRKYSQTTYY